MIRPILSKAPPISQLSHKMNRPNKKRNWKMFLSWYKPSKKMKFKTRSRWKIQAFLMSHSQTSNSKNRIGASNKKKKNHYWILRLMTHRFGYLDARISSRCLNLRRRRKRRRRSLKRKLNLLLIKKLYRHSFKIISLQIWIHQVTDTIALTEITVAFGAGITAIGPSHATLDEDIGENESMFPRWKRFWFKAYFYFT